MERKERQSGLSLNLDNDGFELVMALCRFFVKPHGKSGLILLYYDMAAVK
jgi:hypothetical protein